MKGETIGVRQSESPGEAGHAMPTVDSVIAAVASLEELMVASDKDVTMPMEALRDLRRHLTWPGDQREKRRGPTGDKNIEPTAESGASKSRGVDSRSLR